MKITKLIENLNGIIEVCGDLDVIMVNQGGLTQKITKLEIGNDDGIYFNKSKSGEIIDTVRLIFEGEYE